MTATLDDLLARIDRHCGPGRTDTPVPRVRLMRATKPTVPARTLYEPLLCLVAQGSKRVMIGDQELRYGAGHHVVVSLDLPARTEIDQASRETPYLAMVLTLDRALLADVLLTLPAPPPDVAEAVAFQVCRTEPALLDSAVRLLDLLDHPTDIPALGPLIEREILYRLAAGEQGAMLRQIVTTGSRLAQISRATAWIRAHYSEPLRVNTLARHVGMSPTTFHRHFKAATAMSPLQFQKQIRLQEARRLLAAQAGDAAGIGFQVGYESPSQFSREYSRLFGAPPLRDATFLRAHGFDPDPPP
ncbi:AraC family transcriptional regulator [Roseospira marina]|uniref:AraC family transcriptional regulator n=1 Tax=Roseospira marina TaxID=140057 RepID=A0A5M6I996_9PROT|nr:AraC family transcriptional regulator [Roseospira marina]KAA5604846.1 AraC family transcriptional regulator [Roseospira marina]MBB4315179.1 AraC-like DNA-binding protein [Roseospira marina]MBB5088179.1 AraC-like DNA-binding protein [Roseospira marina]